MDQSVTSSWWSRNWKWFVPVGCLSAVVVMAVFVGLIVVSVMGVMKSSDAYKEAVRIARSNPDVVQALGSPIEEGFFASGNVNVSGPSGDADLAIPLSGSKDHGTIYLEAHKSAGEWTFSKLVVEVKSTGKRIDLLGQRAGSTGDSEPPR